MSIDWQRLTDPFPAHDIEWKPGATTRDKSKGLAMAYITARAVQDRLDEVFGPGNWKNEFRAGPGGRRPLPHLLQERRRRVGLARGRRRQHRRGGRQGRALERDEARGRGARHRPLPLRDAVAVGAAQRQRPLRRGPAHPGEVRAAAIGCRIASGAAPEWPAPGDESAAEHYRAQRRARPPAEPVPHGGGDALSPPCGAKRGAGVWLGARPSVCRAAAAMPRPCWFDTSDRDGGGGANGQPSPVEQVDLLLL